MARSALARRRLAGFAGAALLGAALAGGQALPFGGEFDVGTGTIVPRLASAGKGSFVVVWTGSDASDSGVFGQRFDADGEKVGGEFLVNTTTLGYQSSPDVGVDPSGKFVVVWHSKVDKYSPTDVYAQRYDAGGSKIGPEFRVNTYTTESQERAAVAARADGSFEVCWTSYGQDYSQGGVFAQRFSASGTATGAEFQVNTNTIGNQYQSKIVFDRRGNAVVAWSGPDLDGIGIHAQRFDPAGTRRGLELQVNTTQFSAQSDPDLAFDRHGNFVVVWNSFGQDGSSWGVFGQRFNRSGEKVGDEFQANTTTAGTQRWSSVAFDGRDDFVVVWESGGGQDGSSYGIFGQRFAGLGDRVGPEFGVNAYTADSQQLPRIVHDGAGFVAAWGNFGGYRVSGRREVLSPAGLVVDAHGIGTSDLNGVLEPGEAAAIEPEWGYRGSGSVVLDGSVPNLGFTGPPGPTYTLLDGTAHYGATAPGFAVSCYDGGFSSCISVQAGGTRPATHWDATLQEDLSTGGTQFWKIHFGDSFADVPRTQPFYRKIETLLHHDVTTGCAAGLYCPGAAVPRDQMAIFVAKILAGGGPYVPTSGLVGGAAYRCAAGGTSLFSDVATTDTFCRHVHYLAADDVTLGCAAGKYCPSQTVTRDAMASFIAKAIVAPGGGAAVPAAYTDGTTGRSYSCAAGSPQTHFTDVPASNAFCKHVHFLWAKGVVDGCSATKYCPTQPVTRDAMAKFLANGFGLELYGP
jgi:hypothetical protein